MGSFLFWFRINLEVFGEWEIWLIKKLMCPVNLRICLVKLLEVSGKILVSHRTKILSHRIVKVCHRIIKMSHKTKKPSTVKFFLKNRFTLIHSGYKASKGARKS
ncbi:hypothetical protein D1B33_03795 [Lysinibacillus yapensis]|uniref:Uncharacterized protein n=1 Tax=Ureibacillus yapensis TaxID=2304605 RepID=A0A396SKT7_9BACL|nr:hypothetical protein D1B33_03795 [Lysinibacillus yapensis]